MCEVQVKNLTSQVNFLTMTIMVVPSLVPDLAVVNGLTHRVCEMLEVLHEVYGKY